MPAAAPPEPKASSGPTAGASGGSSRAAVPVLVGGLAAAVAVSLVLAGAIPGFAPFAHGAPAPAVDDASTAVGLAAPLAAAYDAGELVAVAGLVTTYSYAFGALAGAAGPSCPVSHPLFENVSVPAGGSGYDAGLAPAWILAYANTSAGAESYVAVVGPEAYFLGTLSGAACAAAGLSAIPPEYVSSEAAASAANGGAGAFLAAHPSANAVYLLLVNTTTGEPLWAVAYTNCSYDPATGGLGGGEAGDLFLAEVNATDGVVVALDYTPGEANCSAGLGAVTLPGSTGDLRLPGAALSRPRPPDALDP